MKSINGSLKSLLACGALLAAAGAAQAQSTTTLYGLLETGVRYSTHQNAAGDSQVQMGDGALNPSRWGIAGSEDLGGGMKAAYTLESGFQVKNGVSINGAVGTLNNDDAGKSRLFGRLAFVGLSGDFGSINLGRQYTTAFLSSCVADPLCGGGLVVYSPYILYTGLRQDNMITYQKGIGPATLSAHYVLGEQAGSGSANSGFGLGVGYAAGALALNAAYQENNLPGTVKAKLFTANGSYSAGPAKLMLGYVGNKLSEGSSQNNDALYGGIVYAAGSAVMLTGTAQYDKQSGADGRHLLLVGVADYAFSKRTSAYVEMDYNKYQDAMLPFGPKGQDSQVGLTLGLRHKF